MGRLVAPLLDQEPVLLQPTHDYRIGLRGVSRRFSTPFDQDLEPLGWGFRRAKRQSFEDAFLGLLLIDWT